MAVRIRGVHDESMDMVKTRSARSSGGQGAADPYILPTVGGVEVRSSHLWATLPHCRSRMSGAKGVGIKLHRRRRLAERDTQRQSPPTSSSTDEMAAC